jgi:putative effector of murein hydrolase LrgA (UPF0299 family)
VASTNSKWAPVRKIVATILGAVTTTAVIALGDLVGAHLDQTVAASIVGLAAILAGYLTPASVPPETAAPVEPPPAAPGSAA